MENVTFQEQITRSIILKREKMWFQVFLLKIHKNLSLFGENIFLPFFWLGVSVIGFALIYFFTGFSLNLKEINYDLAFEFPNLSLLLKNLFHAIIISLKNLNPLRIENFYLEIAKLQVETHIFYLFQKLINIILIDSLIGAIRNFIRK